MGSLLLTQCEHGPLVTGSLRRQGERPVVCARPYGDFCQFAQSVRQGQPFRWSTSDKHSLRQFGTNCMAPER